MQMYDLQSINQNMMLKSLPAWLKVIFPFFDTHSTGSSGGFIKARFFDPTGFQNVKP